MTMSREDFLASIKRAAIELLIAEGEPAVAAMLLDATIDTDDPAVFSATDIYVDVPVPFAGHFQAVEGMDESLERALARNAFARVTERRFSNWDGMPYQPDINFRVKLTPPDAAWEAEVKALLAQGGDTNQGAISELVRRREGKKMLTYHELKFASESEIRIAQALERKGVLFFPLAVGVVSETGVGYQDRREVDFLVCQDGVFGVLEVSYHPNRYEKDAEKNAWIKRHGVLCVEHYSAENCYRRPDQVVEAFLSILARYKR